jgi:hypothetical protein
VPGIVNSKVCPSILAFLFESTTFLSAAMPTWREGSAFENGATSIVSLRFFESRRS